MSADLVKFKYENFGEIRVVGIDENNDIYFVASDIAKLLGYKNTSKAIKDHCRWTRKFYIPHPQNPDKLLQVNVIPEGDMYRLVANSKLPFARTFESWIFDEVLPTICKTRRVNHVKQG